MEFISLFQVAADSLATDIGGAVGATVSGWVLLAYSVLNKYATEIGKFVLKTFGAVPAWGKAATALLFAEGIAFVNARWGLELSPDIAALGAGLQGLLVWLGSMGWHSLSKVLFPSKKTA